MIGIRREDKNEWERRAPLTPDHVAQLAETHGITFRVQPSSIRAFDDDDYRKASADLDEDLSACRIVLGVKEVPPDRLLPGKVYVFFAHVTKGQTYNMAMLRRLMELGCTLIDFERIVDDSGRRLIFFGRHAGHAGMIDTLWALGRRLDWEGYETGFADVRRALDYSSLDEAGEHIASVGRRLRHHGLPLKRRPVVFGLTGSGNVTRGALEILERLPTHRVEPENLATFLGDPDVPRNVVYTVRFRRDHRYERCEGGPLDPDELSEHPERYTSSMNRWLSHLTVLVNGAYWEPPWPRLVSRRHLRDLWEREAQPKLRVIGDISCDVDGAIEATVRVSDSGDPVYVYDVTTGEARKGVAGRGPVVLAVDNLPCELPHESTEHFGDALMRFVPPLHRCEWDRPFDELRLPEELRRGTILHRGRLTPRYLHLENYLERG